VIFSLRSDQILDEIYEDHMRQIVLMTEPVLFTASSGEKAISLSIRFDTGPDEKIAIAVSQLPNIVGFFLQLNEFLLDNGVIEEKGLSTEMIGPLTVQGTGLSLGSAVNDSDIILILDVAASRLGFNLPKERWNELLSEARPTVLAASARKSKNPN
jgi:hypothetical protein